MDMVIYSVILFAAALLFFGLAAAIYRGNTNLIHSYHQTHVKEADKKKYGRSLSKGLFVLAASLVLSGVIALWGDTVPIVIASVSVLPIGIAAAFLVIARVQKQFNGGFYSK